MRWIGRTGGSEGEGEKGWIQSAASPTPRDWLISRRRRARSDLTLKASDFLRDNYFQRCTIR